MTEKVSTADFADNADKGKKKVDLIIIGCSAEKANTRSGAVKAQDLYISPLFVAARRYAEATGVPWMILSAKHGLVGRDEKLTSYNTKLDTLSPKAREELAIKVYKTMRDTFSVDAIFKGQPASDESFADKVVEIHAGSDYGSMIQNIIGEYGATVTMPLAGLGIGQRLAWYNKVSPSPSASSAKSAVKKFELLASLAPEAEKALAGHKKNIKVYADGVRRSGAQLFGYAYLAGREMNLAKEILPRGQFEKWIEASFPNIAENTSKNWRNFANAIESQRPTVGLLSAEHLQGKAKKKLSKTEEKSVLEIIPQVMDGMGMVEFMRACKFLPEPTPAGGFRPDAEKLEAWLKKNHPEHAGKSWEQLPQEIRDAAPKEELMGDRTPKAATEKESADYVVGRTAEQLLVVVQSETYLKACSMAQLNALEEARLELGRKIAAIKAERKS